MSVGENIKQIRKQKKLTQKQLGKLCGINEAQIRRYELGGKNSNPKLETVEKIATALNVPVSSLIDGLSEVQHIKSTWEWIQNNDEKRKELIIEILKTHNYTVEETNKIYLTVTDHQNFSFRVRKDDFQEMIQRCDKDIRYNIEKLLDDSK